MQQCRNKTLKALIVLVFFFSFCYLKYSRWRQIFIHCCIRLLKCNVWLKEKILNGFAKFGSRTNGLNKMDILFYYVFTIIVPCYIVRAKKEISVSVWRKMIFSSILFSMLNNDDKKRMGHGNTSFYNDCACNLNAHIPNLLHIRSFSGPYI